ncbi:hypothetical protein [Bradyrhizobium sp.]|uniref:hypothetical protein n=1 Tax=Bradyrhizobium sp. TaxID=376 RepID=UPI001EBD05FC|nr:hypothetical protein [Bradyrhizobium sp.]MBV8922966.1 hypothetical protein [Bradyrhizobium sp.]MBV9981033.1 hypothetical protein [Bradyrhizobium sp.]
MRSFLRFGASRQAPRDLRLQNAKRLTWYRFSAGRSGTKGNLEEQEEDDDASLMTRWVDSSGARKRSTETKVRQWRFIPDKPNQRHVSIGADDE